MHLPNWSPLCLYFPVMELHPIFVKGFSGLSYPVKSELYSDAPYKIWRNISNRVDIPINFFQGVKGTFGVWEGIIWDAECSIALINHGRIFWGILVLPKRRMRDDPNGSNDPGASRDLVSSGYGTAFSQFLSTRGSQWTVEATFQNHEGGRRIDNRRWTIKTSFSLLISIVSEKHKQTDYFSDTQNPRFFLRGVYS